MTAAFTSQGATLTALHSLDGNLDWLPIEEFEFYRRCLENSAWMMADRWEKPP